MWGGWGARGRGVWRLATSPTEVASLLILPQRRRNVHSYLVLALHPIYLSSTSFIPAEAIEQTIHYLHRLHSNIGGYDSSGAIAADDWLVHFIVDQHGVRRVGGVGVGGGRVCRCEQTRELFVYAAFTRARCNRAALANAFEETLVMKRQSCICSTFTEHISYIGQKAWWP